MTADPTGTAERRAPDLVRRRLSLALDVADLDEAVSLARATEPWIGVAKVGMELYYSAGPDAVRAMLDLGLDVFVDLKLHDIPTTVGRAATVLGRLGARYVNFHTAGGDAMVRAGVDGLHDGARRAGHAQPVALGVTVLTSEADAPVELLRERAAVAVESGCGGVVCAVRDIATIRGVGPHLFTMTPGIRLAGGDVHDQGRPATPTEGVLAGADLLGLGRFVTRSPDPAEAAARAAREVEEVQVSGV